MFLEGRYKRRNVQWTCITFAAAMEPIPPRKPHGRGRGILTYPLRAVIEESLSPREYRRPTPDWVREMENADSCSSYDEGDFADDFSDEEPTQPPHTPAKKKSNIQKQIKTIKNKKIK